MKLKLAILIVIVTPFAVFGASGPVAPVDVLMDCQLTDVEAVQANPSEKPLSKAYLVKYGSGQKLIDITGNQKIVVSLSLSETVAAAYDMTFYFKGPSLMLARATALTLTADRQAGAYILYRDDVTKKRYGLFCGI